MNTWTITLHADGSPLGEERVTDTVVAAARALAERFGIEVISISTTADSLTATLGAGEAAAVGFAAELRRNTDAWYASKHGGRHLWVTPREA